mgnify:CR=1 FL=1
MHDHTRHIPDWLEPTLRTLGPKADRLRIAILNGVDLGSMYLVVNELRALAITIQEASVGDVLGSLGDAQNFSVPHASDRGIVVLWLDKNTAFTVEKPTIRGFFH